MLLLASERSRHSSTPDMLGFASSTKSSNFVMYRFACNCSRSNMGEHGFSPSMPPVRIFPDEKMFDLRSDSSKKCCTFWPKIGIWDFLGYKINRFYFDLLVVSVGKM